jgi:mannitol-1-phosphate 5-dehydrogenase
MKAVVIGAGRIGCGFAGQLLRSSGYELVFVARDPAMAAHLNRVGCYRVLMVGGAGRREFTVEGVRAVEARDAEGVSGEIASADLVISSVGADNLPDVAPRIAAGLLCRSTPVNVFAFENMTDGGASLRGLVARHLPAGFPLSAHGFSGALISRAVTQRLGDPAGDQPLVFIGDTPDSFVVDGAALCEPLPAVAGMIVAEDFGAWIRRKLYVFSAGHATCAYLGYLKGYHYIHTAIRDPEIRRAVIEAMREGQRGLAACYGPELAGAEDDLLEIISRFENAALADPITRVGRDPRRKLRAEDRLVGAALLAERAGVRPVRLALAAAAALCFAAPADPSADNLRHEIEDCGMEQALRSVTGLDASRGLGRFVAEVWLQITAGWQPDNLLLSLDQLFWAWRA